MSTSTSPVFLIWPVKAKIFVPLLPSVPRAANAAAPSRMILGTLAQVSTLFSVVG